MKILIAYLAFFCSAILGQVSFPNPIQSGGSLPSTCTPGGLAPALFDLTSGSPPTSAAIYECTAANTWTAVGSGSSGSAYSQSFSSQTSVILTHNLGTAAVVIQCFDSSTPPNYIEWNTLVLTDNNNATVTFAQSQSGTCVVNSGGGAAGPAGATGPQGPPGGIDPGSLPNQVLSGCGIEYTSGLTFTVGACTYVIGGTQFTSAITSITLDAADPSNPRLDVIHVNNQSVVADLKGTPAATPAQPTVDYSTELPLNIILVPAGSSTPGGVASTTIYDENSEWTCTSTAHIDCNSTNNPYHGSKDIEATAAVLGNSFTLVKPASGTTDLSTQNNLVCYIRSKAQWPTANNSGASGLRTLSLFWLSGATQVGLQVVIRDNAFGFSSGTLGSYQQLNIPVGLFGTGSNTVTSLKGQITGNGGSSSIGFYIDECSLQAGTASLSLPQALMSYKGYWSSTANYNINDVVSSSLGVFLALVANSNTVVTTTSTWQRLDGIPGSTTPGTSTTLVGPSQIFICTNTCTVTVPVPQLNYQFCVLNDDNVSTVITLAALGSSAQYENTARTAYGTAGTGTLVSSGAVGDAICILGRDSTHYETVNHTGTWTAN